MFVAKFNVSGNFVWAKQMGVSNTVIPNSMVLDGSGNIYTTGYFSATSDFDPGAGIFNLTSAGNNDIFVLKLDVSGNFAWAKQFGGISAESAYSLAVDGPGNIYFTGYFTQSVDFDPGPGTYNLSAFGSTDVFVCKLNTSGNFIWVSQLGGIDGQAPASLALDVTGNVYTIGNFYGTVDFDPGSGVFNIATTGGPNIFISKLNSSGNFVWAGQMGGSFQDSGNSITLDASGNLYTTGSFQGIGDFDPGTSVFNLNGLGFRDVFVAKINQCTPPTAPGTITATGGNTKVCPGESKIYSISNVPGATSYNWIQPVGSSISSGQGTTTITVLFNALFPVSDTLRVTANNSCGTSAQRKLIISRNNPTIPSTITTVNGTKACPGNVHSYSIAAVTNATSYLWTPPPGGVISIGQGTTSISITYGAGFVASDTIRVVSSNACGSSAERKLKISRNNPATPSAVSGQNYGLCNVNAIPYSVTSVAGITYNWNFSVAGATVVTGQGTNAVTANFGSGFLSGTLSVTANNGCGTSVPRNFIVYAKPATPSAITGTLAVCLNQQDVPYSITPLTNVTNYTWSGPTGSTISDGVITSVSNTLVTTSTSVTIDFSTTAGTVKVRGNNACASGSYKSVAVTIVCRETFPESGDEDQFDFSIVPNPNRGEFSIHYTGGKHQKIYGSIVDLTGSVVAELELQNDIKKSFNFHLASGIYFVRLQTNEDITIKKIVIE